MPQTWNAEEYARHARFVADLGDPTVKLLDPQPGERILDLGCGDGALTEKLVEMGCDIVAVDGGESFVEATRKRGIDVRLMDGQALTFENEFDAVFSNAALHWMKDADAVIAGVHRALKPDGRFVGEMGGHGNIPKITAELYHALTKRGVNPVTVDPWYFPTADEYAEKLAKGGFRVDEIETHPRPTALPGDVRGWLTTFAQNFTTALPVPMQAEFLDEVVENLRPKMQGSDGIWTEEYIRVRFHATKV